MLRWGSSRTVVAAVGLLAGVGLTSVVTAAVPTRDGRVVACLDRSDGAARIVDPSRGQRCHRDERRVLWRTGWRHRGSWDAGTAYRPGDVVRAGTASFVARRSGAGRNPVTHPRFWGVVARDGAAGADGVDATAAVTTPLGVDIGLFPQIISAGAIYNRRPVPGATVTVAGPVSVVVAATAVLGVSTGTAHAEVGVCHGAPGQVFNFEWLQPPLALDLDRPRQPVSVTVAGSLPAGSHVVGVCVAPVGDLDANGRLSGWISVRQD